MGRWVLAFTFLLIAVLAAFVVLSVTGVIDGPALLWSWAGRIDWLQPHLATYSRGQEAETWIAAQEAELMAMLADLENRYEELRASQNRLEQRSQQLDKRESELAAWEARLQAEAEHRRSVQNLAEIYSGMQPQDAAHILQELDRELVLQVLLEMDTFTAADILTLLPTNLAAALSKELGRAGE